MSDELRLVDRARVVVESAGDLQLRDEDAGCPFGGGGPGGRSAGDTTSASRKGFGFGAGDGGGGGVSNGAGAGTFGKDGATGCPGFVFIEWC